MYVFVIGGEGVGLFVGVVGFVVGVDVLVV